MEELAFRSALRRLHGSGPRAVARCGSTLQHGTSRQFATNRASASRLRPTRLSLSSGSGIRTHHRALATEVELRYAQDGPPSSPSLAATPKIRTRMRGWQAEYDAEQFKAREAERTAAQDQLSFVAGHARRLYLTPPGKLPPNAFGTQRTRDRQGLPFPCIGDLLVSKVPDQELAVLVYRSPVDDRHIYYGMRGNYFRADPQSSRYMTYPGVFSPEDVLPLLPHLPMEGFMDPSIDVRGSDLPVDVGMMLRRRLFQFQDDIDKAFFNASERIENAAQSCRLAVGKDPGGFMSLEHIASLVYERPATQISVPQMAALFLYGILPNEHFGIDSIRSSKIMDSSLNVSFHVSDKVQHNEALQAMLLYKAYRACRPEEGLSTETILVQLARRARAVISQSRRHRDALPSFGLGPHGLRLCDSAPQDARFIANLVRDRPQTEQPDVFAPIDFSDYDGLVSFLKAYVAHPRQIPDGLEEDFSKVATAIMQESGMYPWSSVAADEINLFLREIGVLPPALSISRTDQIWKEQYLASAPNTNVEDLQTSPDLMAEFRYDFGAMKVFCIDSPDTVVVDDGISLEPISSSPGTFWVHIHVANPTAMLQRRCDVTRAASRRVVSVYGQEFSEHMIPWEIVQHWSLQNSSRVLTFSARLERDGSILETTVRPGTIGAITRVSPRVVEHIVNPEGAAVSRSDRYVVGDPKLVSTQQEDAASLAEELPIDQKEALRTLTRLAQGIEKDRQKGMLQPDPISSTKLSIGLYGLKHHDLAPHEVQLQDTDPTIVLEASTNQHITGSGVVRSDVASSMLATFMTLAGEIAGKYCAERNIPIPYFADNPDPSRPDAEPYYREVYRTIAPERTSAQWLASTAVPMPQLTKSLTPSRSKVLGANGRTQATSPLRRYTDLLVHLQITGALRLEADGNIPIVFEENDPRLTFSHDKVRKEIPRIERHIAYWRRRERSTTLHWAQQFITRAVHFGENTDFPKEVEVVIAQATPVPQDGKVLELDVGVPCLVPKLGFSRRLSVRESLEPDAPALRFRPGERWLARWIVPGSCGRNHLLPIKLLGREELERFRPEELDEDT